MAKKNSTPLLTITMATLGLINIAVPTHEAHAIPLKIKARTRLAFQKCASYLDKSLTPLFVKKLRLFSKIDQKNVSDLFKRFSKHTQEFRTSGLFFLTPFHNVEIAIWSTGDFFNHNNFVRPLEVLEKISANTEATNASILSSNGTPLEVLVEEIRYEGPDNWSDQDLTKALSFELIARKNLGPDKKQTPLKVFEVQIYSNSIMALINRNIKISEDVLLKMIEKIYLSIDPSVRDIRYITIVDFEKLVSDPKKVRDGVKDIDKSLNVVSYAEPYFN